MNRVELVHNFIDKKSNRHWFTKAIRKGTNLFYDNRSIAEEGHWDEQKARYFSVVDSFMNKVVVKSGNFLS